MTAETRSIFQRAFPRTRFPIPYQWVLGFATAAAVATPALSQAGHAGFDCPTADERAKANGAYGRQTERPVVHALPLDNGASIQLDGRLNDAAWADAAPGSGFSIWDPDRGAEPSEQTVFKIAYDADAVYFGVACHETDPSSIAKKLSRRDRFVNSDIVAIYIDPYHDQTTGYTFKVNPLGVQLDEYVYDDGNTDRDWDAVWSAETSSDDKGWYAEIRVPFSSIRYRADSPTWGLQVYRYMHGRGEDTSWASWDRETPGFVSRFGVVDGFKDVPAPRQVEILPYIVGRLTDPSAVGKEDKDDFENFGADIKFGITSDLTLNATVQPDFGQVEADPAQLNLSPFETFFSEKRPFFIEGSRFFQMPNFNLFYSRRIGTGGENSRIRWASKLTGKIAGGISVAGLYASADVTQDGQAHNFLKEGSSPSHFAVTRLGKEWRDGKTRVNVMQTARINTASREEVGNTASRDAATTGIDFRHYTPDRSYSIDGSFVGSIVAPEKSGDDDPSKSYGTGGEMSLQKNDGFLRMNLYGRWESDRLDLNDLGFLGAPDDMSAGYWAGYNYSPEGEDALLNRFNVNFNLNASWLYAGRAGSDLHTGERTWNYSRGIRQGGSVNMNGWMRFQNYAEAWWGGQFNPKARKRFETRGSYRRREVDKDGSVSYGNRESLPWGGPLIDEPTTYGGWWGASTDTRKDLVFDIDGSQFFDTADNFSNDLGLSMRWTQSSAINHRLSGNYNFRIDDTQHLDNFENVSGGIGGVSHVFGEIKQKTISTTLRTNVLFSRNQSLELYLQPFLTTGDYHNARELVRPDSYELRSYTRDGYLASDEDFSFASMNVNAVYRWEYRPGSTLFLVWAQNRNKFESRDSQGSSFDNGLGTEPIFSVEPENTLLVKVSYWLPL